MIRSAVCTLCNSKVAYPTPVNCTFYSTSISADPQEAVAKLRVFRISGFVWPIFAANERCQIPKVKLSPQFDTKSGRGSRIEPYKMQKRFLHSRSFSQERLESILENKILKGTVIWQKLDIGVLTVNLGDGIIGYLFPAVEDQNTSIRVTDGIHTAHREIAEFFLENWSVSQENILSQEQSNRSQSENSSSRARH